MNRVLLVLRDFLPRHWPDPRRLPRRRRPNCPNADYRGTPSTDPRAGSGAQLGHKKKRGGGLKLPRACRTALLWRDAGDNFCPPPKDMRDFSTVCLRFSSGRLENRTSRPRPRKPLLALNLYHHTPYGFNFAQRRPSSPILPNALPVLALRVGLGTVASHQVLAGDRPVSSPCLSSGCAGCAHLANSQVTQFLMAPHQLRRVARDGSLVGWPMRHQTS